MAKSKDNTTHHHHHQKQTAKSPFPKEKNTHYSSVQLSQSTQFSYQHHFIIVINKIKHTEGYGL